MSETNRFRLFSWLRGEISFGLACGAGYSIYHDTAHIYIYPLFCRLFVRVPMVITQRPGTEDWDANYGFTFTRPALHLNWRDKTKVWWWPWSWDHFRTWLLWPDGSLHSDASGPWKPVPEEIKSGPLPYRYLLHNGEWQGRTATVYGEEREWRLRWAKWLAWPCKIRRTISIEFSEEVGERTGSWKGGVTGCGWEWRHGETQEQALRRMERERKFT